ncbi:MAG: hypothetical protein ACLPQS_03850 [Acidimicrobiales bacterium]
MTDPELTSSIRAEAERIRTDGSLPAGFEPDLAARFGEMAADPTALEAEIERGLTEPDRGSLASAAGEGQPAHAGSIPRRALGKATRVSRRAASAGRRRMGPKIRTVERRTIEVVGAFGERASTRVQIASDRARRVAVGSLAERGLSRTAAARGAPNPRATGYLPKSIRVGPTGELGDDELDRFIVERLEPAGGHRVLHAECGDGALVRRLQALGLDASGADARHGVGRQRRGALEALAHEPVASLGGIVLTGVTGRITSASARALARMAATRLGPAGVVVLTSAHPGPLSHSDPITTDLSIGRSLHPVTWCHLLARLGFEDIEVRESADGSAYVVAATKAS